MKLCGVLGGAAIVLAMMCGCGADSAKPPIGATAPPIAAAPTPAAGSQGSRSSSPGPASADDPDENAPGACGSETCALDQFCEDLYKGHELDARGRPLNRKKCQALPASCKATPTCACVTRQVASTHCTDEGGRVYVNDYPAQR